MKYKNIACLFLVSMGIFFLSSCGSSKDIVYFQDIENSYNAITDSSLYLPRIANGDNLLITVISSKNVDAAQIFNTIRFDRTVSTQTLEWQGYLVDQDGCVNFPLLGKVKLSGMTKNDAVQKLQQEMLRYIEDPVVNVRFMNYKVTVLGEVNRPGTFTVSDEKMTIPQAIALAGDLTIYGKRHDILICREVNGEKQFKRIDLGSPEIFSSPYYYLQQNDIVYISPNGTKASSSTYNANLPLFVSLISVAITAIALFLR